MICEKLLTFTLLMKIIGLHFRLLVILIPMTGKEKRKKMVS